MTTPDALRAKGRKVEVPLALVRLDARGHVGRNQPVRVPKIAGTENRATSGASIDAANRGEFNVPANVAASAAFVRHHLAKMFRVAVCGFHVARIANRLGYPRCRM